MNKNAHWHIPITIVFLFLSIMLSLQFQAQKNLASELSLQKSEDLIAMARGLSDKRQKLALEINDLRGQVSTQLESERDEQKLIENITQEMGKLQVVNGNLALKGPGLMITLEDHMAVVYTDVLTIVNELWNAGAEAISINDNRLIGNYTITYVEDTDNFGYGNAFIMVNHQKLDFPITIKAIGEPNNLEKGQTLPGGIMDKLAAYYHAYPEIQKVDEIIIPPANSARTNFFIREYKPE